MRTRMLSVILILALIPVASKADDTIMGSRGGNVFPATSDSIQMVKEEVYIKLYKDSCKVYCKFWFYNLGESESVEVGFPDNLESPDYKTPPLRNFTAKTNGTDIEVRKAEQVVERFKDGSKVKRNWYTWKMNFPGKATTFIENSYVGSWGGTYYSRDFTYEIGTGRTWFKNIGEGKIVFDHSHISSSYFVIKSKKPSPSITATQYEESLIYTFQNYSPSENEFLKIEIWNYWDFIVSPDFFKVMLKEYQITKKAARLMRNEIFARYGYQFHDPKLKEYFERKTWYEPNPEFKFEDLRDKEQLAVEIFKEYEASLK